MIRLKPFLLLLGIAALVAAPIGQGNYIVYTLASWLIFSITAMGLNLTLGYAGQISLAHSLFIGVGAMLSAALLLKLGVNMWLGLVISAVISGALGAIIALLLHGVHLMRGSHRDHA